MPATENAVFDALADPTRRELMTLIGTSEGATPTQLAARLPVTRQAISKHLGILEGAALVASERSGREVRYTLTPAPLSDAVDWMATVGGKWDDRLAALRRRVG